MEKQSFHGQPDRRGDLCMRSFFRPDPALGHANWSWPVTFYPTEVNDSGPVTGAVTSESVLSRV